MTNVSILKIESDQGPVLISKNATQEIFPKSKIEITRDVNMNLIKVDRQIKLKSTVETKDSPDALILEKDSIFKIYSIIKLKQFIRKNIIVDYVEDSLEEHEGYVIYRPILNMVLVNFNCKNDCSSFPFWKFEFEET
ncbi:MAG: hypothetical protein LBI95_01820 [Holosporales bacterium]|jgi:hypothetical protein|nr:hypothetical protein [Holosporales bacterium]